MTKLLAFSDIHMKPEGQTTLGVDPYDAFKRALTHGLKCHADAERIILMGDLANSGQAEEYARLAELLHQCPIPLTILPGNHDNRTPMSAALPQSQPDEHGHIQSVFDTPSHRVICLDTVFGPPFVEFAHMGVLDDIRAAWLARHLSQTDKPVLLIAHHPPHMTGFEGIDEIRLRDDDKFYDVIAQSGARVHLLCGHVHRTIAGTWRTVPFTTLKSTCHQTPLLGLGHKDLNIAVPEPGAYGVVLLQPDGVIIHTEDFDLAASDLGVLVPTNEVAPNPPSNKKLKNL